MSLAYEDGNTEAMMGKMRSIPTKASKALTAWRKIVARPKAVSPRAKRYGPPPTTPPATGLTSTPLPRGTIGFARVTTRAVSLSGASITASPFTMPRLPSLTRTSWLHTARRPAKATQRDERRANSPESDDEQIVPGPR